MRKGIANILTILITASIILGVATTLPQVDANPTHTIIRAKLKEAALEYNIPSVILMGIAYTESGWRQFDANGEPLIHYNTSGSFDIGIMQINSTGRSDIERLKTDIFYNIEIGAKILDGKWKITPGVGDRDRNVLENWYYAIWAYNGFSYTNHPANPEGRRYQEKVLNNISRLIIGDDGQPLWEPVSISRPDPLSILPQPQWIPTPTPYHYGDLFSGIYEGNNARLVYAPENFIAPRGRTFKISFLFQNVGTTTWNALFIKGYEAQLRLSKDSKMLLLKTPITHGVEPGTNTEVSFEVMLEESGIYEASLALFKGEDVFTPQVETTVSVFDYPVSDATLQTTTPLTYSDTVSLDLMLNVPDNLPLSHFMEVVLTDLAGNKVYESLNKLEVSLKGDYRTLTLDIPVGVFGALKGRYRILYTLYLLNGDTYPQNLNFPVPYASFEKEIEIYEGTSGLFIGTNPQGAEIYVNGASTGMKTPAFLTVASGIYIITLVKEHFEIVEFEGNVSEGTTTFLEKSLVPIKDEIEIVTLPSSIDFGEIYKGVSLFKNIRIEFAGWVNSGIVSSAPKWISVYPLSFNTATTFTVAIDSRWLEEGEELSGSIVFSINGMETSVVVKARTLRSSVELYLEPSEATLRVDERAFISIKISSPLKLINEISSKITYDGNFLKVVSVTALSESFEFKNLSWDNNAIFIEALTKDGPISGEMELVSIEFASVSETIPDKTIVEFETIKVTSDNGTEDVIKKNAAEIQILERLRLPGSVPNLTGEAMVNRVKLSWQKESAGSNPTKSYEVYRSTMPDMSQSMFIGSVKESVHYFIDSGPFKNTPYYYWVVTIDSAGNSSTPSGPVEAKPIVMTEETSNNVKLEFYIGKPFVYVNGILVKMEASPFIEEGRTFVPVRYVAQPFGATVTWSEKERKVTLLHKKSIELWIGNPLAMVDGNPAFIDPQNNSIVPFIIEGRTFLPLRFVAENLGATVLWDPLEKKVTIDYSK